MFEGLERITYQPGDIIFQEGDEGDCAYLIESGKVEVSTLQENEFFRVSVLEKGDLFGEMALIDKKPRIATVKTIEETQVVSISRDLIKSKLTNVDPIIGHLLRVVLNRFRDTHHRLTRSDQFTSQQTDKESDSDLSKTQRNLVMNIRIAMDIKEAIGRDEFQLHYQPIISIKDGRLVCFEALNRWFHPKHGLMSPMQFLEIAEETGQILPLGIWTLQRACRDLNTLLKDSHNTSRQAPLFISVNLSARQLVKAEDTMQFASILNDAGVDPACIKLEVTETSLIKEPIISQHILIDLRDLGFRVSLDNFGTGYSSLSHLLKFPVDDIKIDRSFVSKMLSDHDSMQIVKASIGLAKALDLEVVAEGVENKEDIDKLIEMDCSYAQGYYYAKPLFLAEAKEYLRQN